MDPGNAKDFHQEFRLGTSLAVQWLRIHLDVQGTWVQPLVRELKSYRPWRK